MITILIRIELIISQRDAMTFYMAQNDVEGLMLALQKTAETAVTFNKETGEFGISPGERMRLKALAEATGQDYENLAEIKKKFPFINKVKSLNELLRIDLDGIIIATNTSSHFQIAKKCLLANHNIFVEKPVTNSLKKLKELKN